MAAAPALSGGCKRTTALADTADAIDTKIAPSASVMAPTPPPQPNDAGSGASSNASNSRLPSGLPSPNPFPPSVDGSSDTDTVAHALAGTHLGTPSPPNAEPSPTAARVQESLAASRAERDQPSTRHHHLYVGNLSPKVSEEHLRSLFSEYCAVVNVKILIHHHPQYPPAHAMYGTPYGPAGLVAPQMVPGASNYGFVEVSDYDAAEAAVDTLNGKNIFDMPIKVTWAKQQRTPAAAPTNSGSPSTDTRTPISGLDDLGNKPPTFASGLHHVFVGDLSSEVNDAVLRNHFAQAFPSLHEARVMWDMHSGKTRGYGFLAFQDRSDAEEVIRTKNGDWLGGRAIRVNWANQKGSSSAASPGMSAAETSAAAPNEAIASVGAGYTSPRPNHNKIGWGSAARNRQQTVQQQVAMQVGLARGPMNSYNTPVYAFGQQPPGSSGPPRPAAVHTNSGSSSGRKASFTSQTASSYQAASPSLASAAVQENSAPLTFEEVLHQTPPYNTTVYVGNLPPQTGEQELKPLFRNLGLVVEVRMQSDRGYGFVKLDTHENAAQAIVQLNGMDFGGKQIKCAWGKDRQDAAGPSMDMRSQRGSFSHPAGAPHPSAIAAAGMQVPHAGMGMVSAACMLAKWAYQKLTFLCL